MNFVKFSFEYLQQRENLNEKIYSQSFKIEIIVENNLLFWRVLLLHYLIHSI